MTAPSLLKPLGKTGLEIPNIVFGATTLGNLFRAVSEQEKSDIVAQWLGCGLPLVAIDSAGKYGAGLSLEVIGRELKRHHADMSSVLISNKLGWRRVPLQGAEPTFEPGVWFELQYDAVQDISYDGILRCWEEGNQLLSGYNAQLVSVHDPDEYLAAANSPEDRRHRLEDIVAAYRALCELRDARQVAAVGVGAKNWQVIRELSDHCDFDWVMFANSFTIMHHPPELIQFMRTLADRQIGIINSALFHGGFLLGGSFFDYRAINPQDAVDQSRLQWRTRFQEACNQLGYSPFEVGVAFGKSHPAVTSIALSSSRPDRVAEHVRTASITLPPEAWKRLKQLQLVDADYPFV